jgi:hypothetical protein
MNSWVFHVKKGLRRTDSVNYARKKYNVMMIENLSILTRYFGEVVKLPGRLIPMTMVSPGQ